MSPNEEEERARGTHLRLVREPLATPRVPSTARDRIEIVPLPDPTAPYGLPASAAEPIPSLAPTAAFVDRRRPDSDGSSRGDALARLHCPACGMRARIDLVDLATRRVHLSCDRCYRMWQEQIRAGDPARLARRR